MATSKTHTLKLAGELALRQVGEIGAQLRDAIAHHKKIDVDGAGISAIDISVIQLLVSAFKTANAADKNFCVSFPAGSALDTALQRTGFITSEGIAQTPESGLWARSCG